MGHRLYQDQRGFTLIELLVVLLILTTLASIGISIFLTQRTKAQDAEAKTGASLVAAALQIYQHDHDTFVGADRDALILVEPTVASVRGLVLDVDVDWFEISVDSASDAAGGGPFVVEHGSGFTEHRCLQPGSGGCPDSGEW